MKYANRAGFFMNSAVGYKSFVPAKLPPNPPIQYDDELQGLLSLADRKLGRLDGVTQILPNPELFVAMYVKKEAVLSSQIEGTQASFVDVLSTEYNQADDQRHDDVKEVINYVDAMNWGLEQLASFPLSLRLIRNIHARLIHNTRGANKNPGEFRTSQNWIGPAGCTLNTATFVPPTVPDMNVALGDLELFIHQEDFIPALVKIAMIHAQFETIHPFLDGNGRMGRLLITFWLCQQNILTKPLLYLSFYFKKNRAEYYDRLMAVRKNGDWENWIKFFLRGIAEVSDEAIESARAILKIKEDATNALYKKDRTNSNYQRLLNYLFEQPFIKRSDVEQYLDVSNPTAGSILEVFCQMNILVDCTPDKARNKMYAFGKYLDILNSGTELG
mgnify:FL=1